jgi:hypothetical protein
VSYPDPIGRALNDFFDPILDDWDDLDSSDLVHLSEQDGAKLAVLVADIVRERAQ